MDDEAREINGNLLNESLFVIWFLARSKSINEHISSQTIVGRNDLPEESVRMLQDFPKHEHAQLTTLSISAGEWTADTLQAWFSSEAARTRLASVRNLQLKVRVRLMPIEK
eukprot:1160245-Pelagomonas_calceolata.AAC.1